MYVVATADSFSQRWHKTHRRRRGHAAYASGRGPDGVHGVESPRADARLPKPCPLDAVMGEVRRLLRPRAA
jgi:hypothetical protein